MHSIDAAWSVGHMNVMCKIGGIDPDAVQLLTHVGPRNHY